MVIPLSPGYCQDCGDCGKKWVEAGGEEGVLGDPRLGRLRGEEGRFRPLCSVALVRQEKARMERDGEDGGRYLWAEGVWRAPVRGPDQG